MPAYQRNLSHIYVPIPQEGVSQKYKPQPQGGGSKTLPVRNRGEHAEFLKQAYKKVLEEAQQQMLLREPELTIGESGLYVEFQIQSKEIGAVELENSKKKIELLAVRQSEDGKDLLSVTVFIPDQSTGFFLEKIKAYQDQDTKKKLLSNRVPIVWLLLREIDTIAGILLLREFTKGNPKNQALIARLENIRLSVVRKIFTDESESFPETDRDVWWEVWLRHDQGEIFNQVAQQLQIRTTEHSISFPEREVILALTNATTLSRIIRNVGVIAELRLAKDSPSMFFGTDMAEQIDWINDLIDRVIEPSDDALAICLLDSGITRSHRLIEIALNSRDLLTCNPLWGTGDSLRWRGHGTSMAGILLYGDLLSAIAAPDKVLLSHRLESVRILPEQGDNDPKLYGAITKSAVSRVEINASHRQRVICMAITSSYETAEGRPSSWSSAIDQLCFGDRDLQEPQRLMVISIGNISIGTNILPESYPDLNDLSQAENPAQAWNAIVVGAYTDKVNISERKYSSWSPIASAGDLSPRSRTSTLWAAQWPIRPDVVFEGGNLATDGILPGMDVDDLQLLTTYYRPLDRQFNTFGDTSAATALASHMAARIWAEYPQYWPETVRALIVHSAEWTPAMLQYLPKKPLQNHKRIILRRYGYGVPKLSKALQSAQNDLAMILEDDLQPFDKEGSIKAKEMNLHQLPWPKNELEKLREAKVELKITLSYFIEPNPGERGWIRRHSYASHGLRFAVKRTSEELDEFKKRINREAREVEEDSILTNDKDNGWFLGVKMQSIGSIHSDVWHGTAADLAQRDAVAIYPVGGWWKNNPAQEKWDQRTRYALIVSIRVIDDVETDIYTPVENIVKLSTPIDI